MTEKTCSIIEVHSPNRRWQVDQITRVLTLAGKHVSDDSISTLLQLVAGTPELQAYSIVKTFGALRENIFQDALARVAFWLIGEFGELINNKQANIQISEVFDRMSELLNNECDVSIKCYVLNCLIKIYTKIDGVIPSVIEKLKILATDENDEVQQRAFEYLNIINSPLLSIEQKKFIMDAMPIAQVSANIFNR